MQSGIAMNLDTNLEALETQAMLLPAFNNAVQWPRSAMQERQWKIAAQRWALLRRVFPQQTETWMEAALCHQQAEDYAAASALLQAAVDKFAQNAGVLAAQIRFFLACGESKLAERQAVVARQRFPQNFDILHASAQVAQRCDKTIDALDFNAQVREMYPQDPKGWEQYAELAMEAEDWSLALERWTEVRTRFPKLAAGYERAAVAAKKSGKERLARQLKAAKEYGHQWLESICQQDSPPTEKELVSSPSSFRLFLDLVLTKAKMNLKSEVSQNYLRYLWWLIDPLLYMAVFYIFFGLMLKHGGPDYLAYLLTGLVPFQWFAKTVSQASNSIVAGKGLMNQVRLSPLFFPLVSVLQNSGRQLVVFMMLFTFLIAIGLHPTLYWLGFIPIVIVQFVIIVATSCLVSMVVPFIRDFTYIVPTAIQFLFFCSGVFTRLESIPEKWRSVYLMNPMANILYQYRLVFVQQSWPDWALLTRLAVGSTLTLTIIILCYRYFGALFPRVVLE